MVCDYVPGHFSRVRLCATPWTVARQAPLSMGFSRQEYWSVFLCPPPSGDLPYPGIELTSLTSPALAGRFFTTNATWEALTHGQCPINICDMTTWNLNTCLKLFASSNVL